MTKFSREKVLLLHQLIAQETGGEVGLRDQSLLDAALAAAFAGVADREFYPSKEEKAAKLGFDIYVGPNINTIMLASVLCWLQK